MQLVTTGQEIRWAEVDGQRPKNIPIGERIIDLTYQVGR